MSLVFLKGYVWPLDERKARDVSSLIDLLVYRETVLRGRRVFLDFRSNPVREEFDPSALDPEAYEYLEKAGVLFGTPIERLRAMNEPAYQFYLERNPMWTWSRRCSRWTCAPSTTTAACWWTAGGSRTCPGSSRSGRPAVRTACTGPAGPR